MGFRGSRVQIPASRPASRFSIRAPALSRGALILLTPLLPWLFTVVPGGRWLLPLAAPALLYPAFARRVRERRYVRAWGLALLWAALLSAGIVVLVLAAPQRAAPLVLHGETYREEMFAWIATGEGRENDPAAFLPQHLLHLGVFLLLTWVSGGYLGLALGAGLLGYMSYFVGTFAAASGRPLLGSVAAWVPWSVIRVMAFVLLGVLFSRPLLVRQAWPFGPREHALLALAAGGILADLLLKTLFAPTYGLFLRRLVETGAMP